MKASQEVIAVLERAEKNGKTLKIVEQLDRPLYTATNKVLEQLGGKWNRKQQCHVFSHSFDDVLDEVILTGNYTSEKKEFQFFQTPPHVVPQLIKLADLQNGDRLLEPSAGHGAILDNMITTAKMTGIIICELNPKAVEVLKAKGYAPIEEDYLTLDLSEVHPTVAIANPPFSKQQDIDHVNKMLDDCSRKVVAIMSASVKWRENKKAVEFRARVESLGGRFIDMPPATFKTSGTNVSTVICEVTL